MELIKKTNILYKVAQTKDIANKYIFNIYIK
jgi:hypothetical protein